MKILLGITGGIAAYRAVELVRLFKKANYKVQVVMTKHATKFVSTLTLQSISNNKVYVDLFDAEFEQQIGHINLAREIDIILIAPATANFIAQLAHGLAPDLLTTICLATQKRIILAPAMNQAMWHN